MNYFSKATKLTLIAAAVQLFSLSHSYADPVYSGPIRITAPGTYTGNFQSNDPNVPAVDIYTSGEVILENCNLRGPGNLILIYSETKVTVRNCNGYGTGPTPGKFLQTANLISLAVENNYMEGVSKGASVYQFHGKGGADTIKITGNIARNIRGEDRPSFVQFNQVLGVSNVEVAYNQIINEPGQSAVEDNINMYNSSGTPDSPIRIHDNYVQGAYPRDLGNGFSGTGMTSDGDGTLSIMPGNIEADHNTFVSNCNASMNMAGGYNIRYHHNRMVTSSMMPDGSGEIPLGCTWAATASWNNFNLPASSPYYSNNSIDNNVIGFVRRGINKPFTDRQDISECANGVCHDNINLPNPVTLDTEKKEWKLWNDKLISASRRIGSSDHSNNGRDFRGYGANIFFGAPNGDGSPAHIDLPAPIVTSTPAPSVTPTATLSVTPTPTPAPGPAEGSWKVIGYEYEHLTVPDNSTIRYGADGHYITMVWSGGFDVSNVFFGGDPISGVRKGVELYVAGSAPAPLPTAAPEPTPTAAPVPEPTANPVPPASGGTWITIGHENDNVTVVNGSTVRYGANGVYVTKIMSGIFSASNDVFGDPIYGVSKEIQLYVPPVTTAEWKRVGSEGENLSVPVNSTVRYGANGSYVTRVITVTSFNASNEFFQNDPIPGVHKDVEILISGSAN